MRSLLIIPSVLLLLLPLLLPAQNLVPNPGFEDTLRCPMNYNDADAIDGWFWARESPNIFHVCSDDSLGQVPTNGFGTQYPKKGNAYAGMYTGGNISEFREHIGIKLEKALIPDTKYYISFYVSRAEGGYHWTRSASNNIGVWFTRDLYTEPANPAPIYNQAHIYVKEIITEPDWVLVHDSLTADDAYTYIYLGNFFDNSNTDTIHLQWPTLGAYYYIDDICVSEVPNYCYTSEVDSSASDTSCERSVQVFPNPASSQVYVQLPCEESHSIQVIDALGRMVVRQDDFDRHTEVLELEVHGLAAGSYFIQIESSLRRYTLKLIIVH